MGLNKGIVRLARRSQHLVYPPFAISGYIVRRWPEMAIRAAPRQLPACDVEVLNRPEVKSAFMEDYRRSSSTSAMAAAQDFSPLRHGLGLSSRRHHAARRRLAWRRGPQRSVVPRTAPGGSHPGGSDARMPWGGSSAGGGSPRGDPAYRERRRVIALANGQSRSDRRGRESVTPRAGRAPRRRRGRRGAGTASSPCGGIRSGQPSSRRPRGRSAPECRRPRPATGPGTSAPW